MLIRRQPPQNAPSATDRRGTATVEFAMVAPLFLTLVLGIAEMSRALNASQILTAALREGGRLAAMDLDGMVASGSTSEAKVISDIRNMITASGLDGSKFTITIKHAEGTKAGQDFDFDDSANYLQYFKIAAEVKYSDVSFMPASVMTNQKLRGSIVLRMGRSSLTDD